MNLVSLAMQYLGPVIINKIASSLGMGQGVAGKLIAAAIPTILASLAGSSAKPGGAGALGGILSKLDPNILGNLGNLIGGSGQQQLVDSGSNALSSLLGGASTNAIAGALGKFGGIDAAKSSSLLGMLAPVVLGSLAKQQQSSGLDAAGIASLLGSQKDNIAAAMPAGFSDLLKGSGVLDSIAGNLKAPSAPVAAAVPAPSGGSFTRWLLPLAALLGGIYLLTSYMRHETAERVAVPEAKPAATAPAASAPKTEAPAAKVEVPAVPAVGDLAGQVTKALAGLTGSLGGIKDEATAKAALPALHDIAKQVDGFKTAAALLTGDAKAPVAGAITSALPAILAAVEKAVGIPGVGALIKPVLEPLVANLTAMTK
ncbi:MAG: DUF937 domain-containing protein [Hyphomicrobium sp.]